MAAREFEASEAGLPRFSFAASSPAEVFDLDSHRRAREALDFGLSVAGIGFNIFVIGDDRSARMTATLAYIAEAVKARPVPSDWIYLNNFQHPASPTPHRLPPGMGRRFRDRVASLLPRLREALAASFTSEGFQSRIMALQGPGASRRRPGDGAAARHGARLRHGADRGARRRHAARAAAGGTQRARAAAARRGGGTRIGRRLRPAPAPRGRCARPAHRGGRGVASRRGRLGREPDGRGAAG